VAAAAAAVAAAAIVAAAERRPLCTCTTRAQPAATTGTTWTWPPCERAKFHIGIINSCIISRSRSGGSLVGVHSSGWLVVVSPGSLGSCIGSRDACASARARLEH